jgi:preprotein translocase subunit YajC
MFSHSFWGLCAWDLPALIVLALMILIFVIHRDKMKKREEEFEEELEKIQGEEAVDSI